jgi:hypothetical protein
MDRQEENAAAETARAAPRGLPAILLRTRGGRAALTALLLGLFLAGYVAVSRSSAIRTCNAASTTAANFKAGKPLLPDWPPFNSDKLATPAKALVQMAGACPCGPLWIPPPSFCDIPGETELLIKKLLEPKFKKKMASTAYALENFIGNWLVDGMVATMLNVINQAELNLIDWWDTMWFYNLNPALQDMTKQFSVGLADQARALQAGLDAQQNSAAVSARHQQDDKAVKDFKPSENAAVVATLVGGQQRALFIGGAMQSALQNESHASGLNRMKMLDGTPNPGATGYAAALAAKRKLYEDTFCDPNDNGGMNKCSATSPSKFYDIDTQVTKQIYARLTIDLIGSSSPPPVTASSDPGFRAPLFIKAAEAAPAPSPGGQTIQTATTPNPSTNEIPEIALTAILDNMMGEVVLDPVPVVALTSAPGRERFLNRRRDRAREAAVRSVPDFIVGRRMPGSQVGTWVKEIRGGNDLPPGDPDEDTGAGAPASDISPNPSYREVMHAMTVDRFNSGKYALRTNAEEAEIEGEKLMLDAIYLMQLRDYYELLERQAAVLALQVAVIADGVPLPDTRKNQRLH